jgi:sphingolipid delta-4 desaturase
MKASYSRHSFTQVAYPEPHKERGRQILRAHPEVKKLFGPDRRSLLLIAFALISQLAIAYLVKDSAWWVVGLCAFAVGAFFHHAIFVLIHDCTHNLVVKTTLGNRITALVANLPLGVPMAMGFRSYHLLHHRFQGDPKWDADLPTYLERKCVGNNTVMKAFWLLTFVLIEGILRPSSVRAVNVLDRWGIFNLTLEIIFCAALVMTLGWTAMIYLWVSTLFSVGLHPLGARWIQEHFIFAAGQETYSYYGILNIPALNVGYHNEHHDLMLVPWSKLPQVKKLAPEFYDNLYFHRSWTALLFKFLFWDSQGMTTRITRDDLPAGQGDAIPDASMFGRTRYPVA